MFVIAAQVCFLYGSAGLYKVQGGSWGNGTALHYVLNLDLFRPWPELSLLADEHDVLIAVACYLTVLVQVAFPFVLFGRLKYPVLTMLLGMHLGIAVLMGLPLFSGAMIIADAVFLPDRFYRALGQRLRRTGRRTGSMEARASSRGERALVPSQSVPQARAPQRGDTAIPRPLLECAGTGIRPLHLPAVPGPQLARPQESSIRNDFHLDQLTL
jgi:hypothetical protein